MTQVVIDASAALAWLVPSQASQAGWRFLASIQDHSLVAPKIFDWEVRNVLLALARRGAVDSNAYNEALGVYEQLPIDFSEPVAELRDLATFARQSGLSLFDAAYVALALDRECGLVSRDAAQLGLASASGIACFDLRVTE